MKKYTALLIVAIIICLLSCQKGPNNDVLTGEKPEIPSDFDIDLNNDGNPDFAIHYFDAEINTLGGSAIFGVIEPYGENEVLLKETEPKLFLRNIGEVQPTVEDPLIWVNTGWLMTLVDIEVSESGSWPEKWAINSTETFEFYFLGFKLIENNDTKTGWMKLSIDSNNGEIQVVEIGFL
ncbi:MAG: hypothetical protein DHS20C18_39050 [Saprospiraceae bacterium]|nr:MAG: hypothetical protein DHS20C18_39050 [Saprospiraceae bacterium]